MLSRDNEFLAWRRLWWWNAAEVMGDKFVARTARNGKEAEYLAEKARKFTRFTVFATAADRKRERFKSAECGNLGF